MSEFTLILLLLGLIESAKGESRNLALNHPARQSSTYGSLVASKAVDGNKTGTTGDQEVSRTDGDENQWWLVDLQDVYHVRNITVYNKIDNDNPLQDAFFLTSLSDMQDPSMPSALWVQKLIAAESISDSKPITLSPAIPARYVAIFKKTGSIVLREVEVYGDRAPMYRTNLAMNKAAAQSSTNDPTSQGAGCAVNGNYNDFTHTAAQQRPPRWWRVDLGAIYEVESINVYNRKDCCQHRLRNFTISTSVQDQPPSNIDNHICHVQGNPVGDFLYIACERRLTRHLIIYSDFYSSDNNEDNVLALAEVEIYENAAPGPIGITVQKWNLTCCNVTWTSITYLSVSMYQVKCGNIPWKSVSENSATVCDSSLSGNVACSVRGEITGGFTAQATNVTNCTAPRQPLCNVIQAKMSLDGKSRVRLDINCIVASKNCDLNFTLGVNISSPMSRVCGSETGTYSNRTLTCGDLDAVTLYALSVTVINSANLSTSTKMNLTSMELEPYGPPEDITFRSANSTCLTLSWKPPSKPNGKNLQYQYACSSGHNNSTTRRNAQICGLRAGTLVTCNISACTAAGCGPTSSQTMRTNCTAPSALTLKIMNETDFKLGCYQRLQWNVTWNVEEANCDVVAFIRVDVTNSSGSLVNTSRIENKPQGSMLIDGILAFTNYTVTLTAVNNEKMTSVLNLAHSTRQLAPDGPPQIVNRQPINGSCVRLNWNKPLYPNGVINQYKYSCSLYYNGSTEELEATLCSLDAGKSVRCTVTACTTAGCGPKANLTARTNCTAPSALNLKILNESDYKFGVYQRLQWNVTWNVEEANCDSIAFIRVEVTNSLGSLVNTSAINENPQGLMRMEGILAFTNYTVTLIAVNNENMMSFSSITHLTRELAPDDPPQNVNMRPINESCVKLHWDEPLYPNGVINQYNVSCICTNNTYQIPVNESSLGKWAAELCGLASGQKVHCSVQSQTRGGYGPAGNGSGFTHLEVKSLPRPEIMNDGNKVTLRKAELISKVDIAAYHVVMKSKPQTASRFRRELVQENKTPLNYEEAKRLKQSEYIAAAIKPTEFINDKYELELGDNKVYNGYLNAQLDLPDYTVRTGICVKLEADKINCTYSDEEVPFKVSQAHSTDHGSATSIAIGTSIAGLTLLILATVGLVFFRRRRPKPIKETAALELSAVGKNVNRLNSASTGSLGTCSVPTARYEGLQTPLQNAENDKESYDQISLTSKSDDVCKPDETEDITYERVSECIPLDRLEAYVESGERRILSQYEALGTKPSGEMNAACVPENKGKSRYKGLYPVDEFRVHILEPGLTGTDFINASFIKGVSEDKTYIAAQGPTTATLEDFWNMIWQEKPSAIVMVTKCWEEGKAKCEQYWPEKQGNVMEFGNITVELSSEELWASFGMRSLKATKAEKSHTFKQFQYFGWPDHGVPIEIASFVMFYHKVKAYSKMIKKPLLVHCSAGVGRTGTFIAMDYLLEQANAFNMVDPFECVMAMRERRPSMVQTKEQYLFLHKVILEAISTEKFHCNPAELAKRIATFGSALDIDIINQEFQHIETMLEKTEMKFESGKVLSNKERNRNEDVLPNDAYRPFLTGTNGDYINAVFVNSHKEKEKMVATQLPLEHTVQDFWQLVQDQNSVTIIQLQAADEPFFPKVNNSIELKSGLVWNTFSEQLNHFQLARLTQKTVQKAEKKMVLYQFFGWKENHLPEIDSLLVLFEHLQKCQQQTDNHKIIVTCRDGATRCGMFICAFNVIERLRMEQEVDVYNEVLLARLRRPQFVSTSQQYLSLYKILKKYVDAFSEYANFK